MGPFHGIPSKSIPLSNKSKPTPTPTKSNPGSLRRPLLSLPLSNRQLDLFMGSNLSNIPRQPSLSYLPRNLPSLRICPRIQRSIFNTEPVRPQDETALNGVRTGGQTRSCDRLTGRGI